MNIGSFFNITKPLFDIEFHNERCRPDFILNINNKKFVLEVMGFENDEYLERKERTHKIMENIGSVINFDCKNFGDQKLFQFDLDRLARDLYSKFYRK